ncbi:MAG: MFS transporter [Anaerolineae bacterium]
MTRRKRIPQMGRLGLFVLVLLLIEFLDEFVYGAREAAWPMIRTDLGLTYAQIGMLLGVPGIVSSIVEPFLGILGDAWKRRALILGGGVVFSLALLLTGLSQGFPLLLLSFVLFYPASGAFVSLSQATLMDVDPARHEHNMARWTFAGSLGVVAGPLALSAAVALGIGGRVSPWRALFIGFAGLALLLLIVVWRFRFDNGCDESEGAGLKATFAGVWRALRRGDVLRWLTLLQFSDLMLDVLLGYLALYFSGRGRRDTCAGGDGGSRLDRGGAARRFTAHPAAGTCAGPALPARQYGCGTGAVRRLPAVARVLGEVGPAGPVGTLQRRLVFHSQSAALFVDAGAERHGDGGGQRLWLRRRADPVGAGAGRRALRPASDDVAAAPRTCRIAHRCARPQ